MLTIQFIKENKETTIAGLKKKYFKNAEKEVENVLLLDSVWRETKMLADNTAGLANILSKGIGQLIQQGKKEEADSKKAESINYKLESKKL